MSRVFFIHTVDGLEEAFDELCRELLPGTHVSHIPDSQIIRAVLDAGGVSPEVYRTVCEHVIRAEERGADVIQFTCSCISPCVDVAKHLVSVPVLKIDEPMVEQAVARYKRIGVAATNPTTLEPTTGLLREKGREAGREVDIEPVLCEGAYEAFLSGDRERHDEIVRRYLRDLMKKSDVVVLAQASMARVAAALDESEKLVPVLSSPRPAIERLAVVLEEQQRAAR